MSMLCQHVVVLFYHATEQQESQGEASQLKKPDQSGETDEALYLPPLPPDQLDTVVKVMPTTHMYDCHQYNTYYVHIGARILRQLILRYLVIDLY